MLKDVWFTFIHKFQVSKFNEPVDKQLFLMAFHYLVQKGAVQDSWV